MRSEREEFNKAIGGHNHDYRSCKAFGDKQMLKLQVPRTRNGGFYPVILPTKESRRRGQEDCFPLI